MVSGGAAHQGCRSSGPRVPVGADRCRPRRTHRFTGPVRRRDARPLRFRAVLHRRHRRRADGGRGRRCPLKAGTGPRPGGVRGGVGAGRPLHLGAGTGRRRRHGEGGRRRGSHGHGRCGGGGPAVRAADQDGGRAYGPAGRACGPAVGQGRRDRGIPAGRPCPYGPDRRAVGRGSRRTGRVGPRPAGIPCPAAHRRAGNPARRPWRVSCSRRRSRPPGSAGPPRRPCCHRG